MNLSSSESVLVSGDAGVFLSTEFEFGSISRALQCRRGVLVLYASFDIIILVGLRLKRVNVKSLTKPSSSIMHAKKKLKSPVTTFLANF